MTTQEFFTKYNTKFIDFDGAYGNQCMDLYRQFVKEVLGAPQSPPVTGAAEVWDTYLPAHFDKITNTPEGVPQLGDVVVWRKSKTLPYGHIAIFSNGDSNIFMSFDQNWDTGTPCHFQTHDYMGVIGWLRPKNKPVTDQPTITDQTKIPQIDNQEVGAIKSRLNDMARDVARINAEYKESLLGHEEDLEEAQEHYSRLAKELDDTLQENEDLRAVIKKLSEEKPSKLAILITDLVERMLEKLGVKKG